MPQSLTPLLATSLIDIDATFLPVGNMRQIARVTALDGGGIEGEVDLGPGWPMGTEPAPESRSPA